MGDYVPEISKFVWVLKSMSKILKLVVLLAFIVGLYTDAILYVKSERVDVVVDDQHVFDWDVGEGREIFDMVILRVRVNFVDSYC